MNPLNWTIGQVLGGIIGTIAVVVTTGYLLTIVENPAISQDEPAAVETTDDEEPAPSAGIGASAPRILKFTLTLSEPGDLLVESGDKVTAGQTIADRRTERQRLKNRLELLRISLERIEARTVTAPPKPLDVPPIAPLPDITYRQEEAALQKASRAIDLQQQKLNLLEVMGEDVPAETIKHEQLRLEEMNQELSTAEANLQAAKEARAREEYQHSLNVARRQEEQNQQALYYANQQQEYETQVRDREYQIAELHEKIGDVQQRLEELAIVTAPYDGEIRRIKWLGQTNNLLQVEVTMGLSL